MYYRGKQYDYYLMVLAKFFVCFSDFHYICLEFRGQCLWNVTFQTWLLVKCDISDMAGELDTITFI